MSLGNGHRGHHPAAPVRIVGLGAVCGYGWGEKRLREGVFAARSAVRAVPGSADRRGPMWMAVVDDDGGGEDERQARAVRFALEESLADAQDRGWRPGPCTGLITATRSPTVEATTRLMDEFELNGPHLSLAGSATSGPLELLMARSWIETSMADDVVVLCADVGSGGLPGHHGDEGELVTAGPSAWACRPFQEGSTGPNPGEAAIAMVVTRRSANAYAELRGGAFGHERWAPPANASLLRNVTEAALADAGIAAEQCAYVNAHGCGVPAVDDVEAGVVDEVFAAGTCLYSMKPLVGDCGTAAGAVELTAALYGFSTGVVPAPARVAPGHSRLLDGPTAAVDGSVVKVSVDDTGSCAVAVLGPPPG